MLEGFEKYNLDALVSGGWGVVGRGGAGRGGRVCLCVGDAGGATQRLLRGGRQ